MNIETVFTICNSSVIPLWVLLAVAPGWKGTQYIVHSMVIPLALAVVYGISMATAGETEGGFGSLAGVRELFSDDRALLAGWIHYLVFDLFIGAWEVRDARRLKINHYLVVPCLFFTLMAGPVGLLMYFILRWTLRKKFMIDESINLRADSREAQ
jgi:hypothetical protein